VWNEYAREKLQQIEMDLAATKLSRPRPAEQRPARTHRPLAPLARATGRPLRRIGEALESWAATTEPRRTRSWREGGTG
jgi:hypothetical protein